MKYCLFILFFLIIKVHSQNLVPNYSFEDTLHCPSMGGQINFAHPWFQPTTGTPDYFNECSSSSGVPYNGGYQYAKAGKAYAGFILFAFTSYREYIEAPLISPLIAKKKYCVSFYVNLSERSNNAIDAIGLYFSTDSITSNNYFNLSCQPQVKNLNGNILSDTANWIQISGEYIAGGGEKYITIGNFKNNTNTDSLFLGGGGGSVAYYYIDDISIALCDTSGTSIKEEYDSTLIFLYPSPTQQFFNIELPLNSNFNISIFDITGRKVHERKNATGTTKVDCGSFSSGIYFVQAVSEKTVLMGKLIKE